MCGIFFACSNSNFSTPSKKLLDCLQRRGPDHVQEVSKTEFCSDRQLLYLTFLSTVLSLRGDKIYRQPCVSSTSNSSLCWNGEAWSIGETPIVGSDIEVVFDRLCKASVIDQSDSTKAEARRQQSLIRIINVLTSIDGPYAFVFYDATSNRILFGRDPMGRRSLLMQIRTEEAITISSVCDPENQQGWEELEAGAIYHLQLPTDRPRSPGQFEQDQTICAKMKVTKVHYLASENITQENSINILGSPRYSLNKTTLLATPPSLSTASAVTSELADRLYVSLRIRANNIPATVSQTPNAPRFAILFSGGVDCTLIARMVHEVTIVSQDIDLLNVAFENPRVIEAASKRCSVGSCAQSSYELCPDRVTGRTSHLELERLCPGRTWRFVSIDIPYTELMDHRGQIIMLMHPHSTEMDFSIACALFFAARGKGTVQGKCELDLRSYTTPARVLLSGLGADELFGGYGRHAISFKRNGYSGLISELQLDFNRLGQRNLGRDDRMMSHWGKEVRYPYLDDNFVGWALGLPVWDKCGYEHGEDSLISAVPASNKPAKAELEPGKRVLRLLAQRLGIHGAAMNKKRAIQFGARSAKMGSSKRQGTQILEELIEI